MENEAMTIKLSDEAVRTGVLSSGETIAELDAKARRAIAQMTTTERAQAQISLRELGFELER